MVFEDGKLKFRVGFAIYVNMQCIVVWLKRVIFYLYLSEQAKPLSTKRQIN